MIVTLPVPRAEMIEDDFRYKPLPNNPVPHEVPLTVIEPVLVVTLAADASMP